MTLQRCTVMTSSVDIGVSDSVDASIVRGMYVVSEVGVSGAYSETRNRERSLFFGCIDVEYGDVVVQGVAVRVLCKEARLGVAGLMFIYSSMNDVELTCSMAPAPL